MDHFYDNSLQSGLMRDLALDLEVLGESVVLLGNQVGWFLLYGFLNPSYNPNFALQGVGKNKIIDRYGLHVSKSFEPLVDTYT
jgi:hypothetical protein